MIALFRRLESQHRADVIEETAIGFAQTNLRRDNHHFEEIGHACIGQDFVTALRVVKIGE